MEAEDSEDDDDDEEEEEEGSGEDAGEEDAAGVRVGRFGRLEVVADEDDPEDGGFDQTEYQQAMAALRKGRMLPSDLNGMDLDARA